MILPELGRSSPASWPRSVVLPAPFGPMTARTSPRATSRLTPEFAVTPAKCLVSPVTVRRRSATVSPPLSQEQRVGSSTVKQDHEQHDRAQYRHPVGGQARKKFLEQDERCRSYSRPEHRPDTTKDHH